MKLELETLIIRAEGRWRTARREAAVADEPTYDSAADAAHLSVELYFKACLMRWGREVPKTHDLRQLLDMCLRHAPEWASCRADMSELMSFDRESTYEGEITTAEDAQQAVDIATRMRTLFKLALQTHPLFEGADPDDGDPLKR